jgi:hypothetical protein
MFESMSESMFKSDDGTPRSAPMPHKRNGRQAMPAAALSLGFLEVLQFCLTMTFASSRTAYCSSLVTSCWMLLACASAAMPVWLRISNFDRFEVAEA